MKSFRIVGIMFCLLGALAGCGGGGSSPSSSSSTTSTSATAVIQVVSGVSLNTSTNSMTGVVGQQVDLSASGSRDQGSTIVSYGWSVASAPSGSTAKPSDPKAADTRFTPDRSGDYTLHLTVTDAQGTSATQSFKFNVFQHAVTLQVNQTVVFNAVPSSVSQNVQVGSQIMLDASGSTSAGGKPVTIKWTLVSKPFGSAATLPASGSTATFQADIVGTFMVAVTATDSSGDIAVAHYSFVAAAGPSAVVVASITSANGLSGTLQTDTNYLVELDGSHSVSTPGDAADYVWTLVQKPAGSAAALSALTGTTTTIVPDVVGNYIVSLTYTDTTTGQSNTYTLTLDAAQGPVAIVSAAGSPVAVATSPAFVSSVGVPVTLLGDGSYELDGDPLSYAWALTSRPSGSTAILSNSTAVDATFTPDLAGTYGVKLTVTDQTTGAAAVSTATIQVGAYQPVAVASQTNVSILLGGTVTDSAALSYDPQGNPITFAWQIDAAPAGSTAAISGATNTAALSFTPDVAGTYTLSVTVSNGVLSSDALVTITAFSASAGTIPLPYQPLMEKYNRTTDKLFIVSANPNALHIVDLNGVTDTAVPLPAVVKDFAVSPDGTKAAVLHSSVVDVIDLTSGTLLHSWPTSGAQTMVIISNSGLIYLAGQSTGCCNESMQVLDAGTGALVQTYTSYPALYQATGGVLAEASNQIFVNSGAIGLYSLGLDPGTGQIASTGAETSYMYSTCGPMWLSSNESLLFTCNGNYFSTSGLTYSGTLGVGSVISVSDDANIGEAVALTETESVSYPYNFTYSASYHLFSGSNLFPQGTVPLPLVAGLQSYGIAMFHSSSDQHVMVVQTGTNQIGGAGAQYYALLR